eukprot:9017545-Heterocapsa_arctica.AAC.1
MVANGHVYVDDTVNVVTLNFYVECGDQHYANYMDQTKCMEEFVDITVRTKPAIIESILGLGYIYAKEGYEELKDMPDIINEAEKGLRSYQHKDYKHTNRGQHPFTKESWKDYEVMGDGKPEAMEDWPWGGPA